MALEEGRRRTMAYYRTHRIHYWQPGEMARRAACTKAADVATARTLLVGPGPEIGSAAIVGELPSRPVADLTLRIGAGAFIRSCSVLHTGSTFGSHFTTGHHVIIRGENRIGDYVSIWGNSTVDYGRIIGDYVKIHTCVYLAQFTTLEDGVFLAPRVAIGVPILWSDRYLSPLPLLRPRSHRPPAMDNRLVGEPGTGKGGSQ